MSWSETWSTFRFFLSWTKKFFILVALIIIVFVVFGIILWAKSSGSFILYLLCVCAPVLLALLTVLWILFKSGYMKIAIQLGYRGRYGPDSSAGLAYIKSTSNRVLLNLQSEPPWVNMWCLPGGYYNQEKGDSDPSATAVRRLKEIAGVELVFAAKIAQTNGSPEYLQTVIDNGHGPIQDHLYLLLNNEGQSILETDIPEVSGVKWYSWDDIRTNKIPVPDHMLEIIGCLLDVNAKRKPLRSWTISPDYEQYWLQRLMPDR